MFSLGSTAAPGVTKIRTLDSLRRWCFSRAVCPACSRRMPNCLLALRPGLARIRARRRSYLPSQSAGVLIECFDIDQFGGNRSRHREPLQMRHLLSEGDRDRVNRGQADKGEQAAQLSARRPSHHLRCVDRAERTSEQVVAMRPRDLKLIRTTQPLAELLRLRAECARALLGR